MTRRYITPEEQTALDASIRKFNLDQGGNNRAWRKATAALIKARARERRAGEKILAGITGRAA